MLTSILSLLRVRQWTKNVFVLAVPFFSGNVLHSAMLLDLGIAFAAACLASSIVYIINDLADRELDKANLKYKVRPIASGDISVMQASLILAILAVSLVTMSLTVIKSTSISVLLYSYITINIFYSYKLKFIAVLEVFVISSGFVLRLLVGALAAHLEASIWIILLTWLLSLFMVLGKRLAECELGTSRLVNASYSRELLIGLLLVVTAQTIIAYVMFCIDPPVMDRFGKYFGITIPVVMFGLFQYLRLLIVEKRHEEPTHLIFVCKELYLTGIVWLILVTISIYTPSILFPIGLSF